MQRSRFSLDRIRYSCYIIVMENEVHYDELSPFSINHAGGIHPLDQLELEAEDDYTRSDSYVGRMQEVDDLYLQEQWEDQHRLEELVESPVSEGGWGMPYSEYVAMWDRLMEKSEEQ